MGFKQPYVRILFGICIALCMGVATLAQPVTKPPVTKPPVTKPTSSKSGSGTAVTASSKSGTKTPSTASSTAASPNPAAGNEADAVSFRSSWGPVLSGNALAAQVASIAPAAILVKDNNGKLYEVSSFRINYKFKSSYRDEEAGSTKFMNDLRVSEFSGTAQLPDYWVSSIKDNIKAGDEIIFNKILFRNKSGKLQLAPELRITVQ